MATVANARRPNRNERRRQAKEAKRFEKRMKAGNLVIVDAPMMVAEKWVDAPLAVPNKNSQGLETIEIIEDNKLADRLSVKSANQEQDVHPAASVPLPTEGNGTCPDNKDELEKGQEEEEEVQQDKEKALSTTESAEDSATVASAEEEPEERDEADRLRSCGKNKEQEQGQMSEPTPPSSVKEAGATETVCVQAAAFTVTPCTEGISDDDDIEVITVRELPMVCSEKISKMELPKRGFEQTKKSNIKLLPILQKITPNSNPKSVSDDANMKKKKNKTGILGLLKKKKSNKKV
ncbi:hypothetical protein EC973_002677 [Apophysomyces ossiformis]|uniref:Uncharacterized protein n=1 Tax=Apophysomyces ossiformis TaxID=679940 RepID=A0A8H7ENH1_9FUNG|nr:hypothetical protein EC973_002677 [Apophysomyces ossiformis]